MNAEEKQTLISFRKDLQKVIDKYPDLLIVEDHDGPMVEFRNNLHTGLRYIGGSTFVDIERIVDDYSLRFKNNGKWENKP